MTLKWPKNDHFYPKNASIDLKICHIVYWDGFYAFPKFQSKTLKIGRFLAKNGIFCWRQQKKIMSKFRQKLIDLRKFLSKLSNFWYTQSLIHLLQSYRELFYIFGLFLLLFYGPFYLQNPIFCHFLAKNGKKCVFSKF